MLSKVLTFAHELMERSLLPGETAIDGTCGKGNDTVKLSNIVGNDGHVFAFDIQQQAIELTAARLKKEGKRNVTLIQSSHEFAKNHLPTDLAGKLGGAIFNLGYLPGGDKSIITNPKSTIHAINTLMELLKPGGVIVLVIYYGHPGGEQEKEAILTHLSNLDQNKFSVLHYGFINQVNKPPFLLAIEKNKVRHLK